MLQVKQASAEHQFALQMWSGKHTPRTQLPAAPTFPLNWPPQRLASQWL